MAPVTVVLQETFILPPILFHLHLNLFQQKINMRITFSS